MTVIARGVDCAYGPPTGQQLNAAGYAFLAGYLRKREPSSVHVLTPAIVADMHATGHGLVLIYESADPGRIVQTGYAGGKIDAAQAITDADALGIPIRAVYFAADREVAAADFGAVDDYLSGAGSQLAPAQVGLYGQRTLIEHVQRTGTAAWFMQTPAWSNGIAAGVHIYQGDSASAQPLQHTIAGVLCDVDEALKTDYGQWPAPAGPPIQGDTLTDAQVAAIEQHEDATIAHAVDEIRTDTAEGNSNANIRAHQDAQGNELADLFAAVKTHFAGIEAALQQLVAHPLMQHITATAADVVEPSPAQPVDNSDATAVDQPQHPEIPTKVR